MLRRQTIDEVDNFDVYLPIKIQQKIVALDYDVISDMVYWLEYNEQTHIYRSYANGTHKERIPSSDDREVIASPIDIAIDPYGRQLYWTDHDSKRIKVTNLISFVIGTVVSEDNGNPSHIALDPKRG